MKTWLRTLATALFVVASMAPAYAGDRIQWYYGQNPPSSWHNQYERFQRLSAGQFFWDTLRGNYFSNLCVTPVSGLNVQVGPCSANTLGALYQYLPEEVSTFGGPGVSALPVDNTLVNLQGMISANLAAIGPLNGPGTGGQSIIYAIECKVQTQDQTSQTVNFVSATGVVTPGTQNRDRVDTIVCQSKAGTAAVSPTAPTIDAGYVGVGLVTVANGTATITSGMISTYTANAFYGVALLNASGQLAQSQLTNGYVDLSSNQTISGTKTFGSAVLAAGFATNGYLDLMNGTGGVADVTLNRDGGATQGLNLNVPSGSTYGWRFLVNGGATIPHTLDASGNATHTGTVQGLVVQSKANGSIAGPVPPCYTKAGASCANTFHMIHDYLTGIAITCAALAGTSSAIYTCQSANITLTTGFTSRTSYHCVGNIDSAGATAEWGGVTNSATQFYLTGFYNSTSTTINVFIDCYGT